MLAGVVCETVGMQQILRRGRVNPFAGRDAVEWVIALIGLLFIGGGAWTLYHDIRFETHARYVPGTVVGSQTVMAGGWWSRANLNNPTVRYDVNAKDYRAHDSHASYSTKYTDTTQVDVAYDPEHPADVTLAPPSHMYTADICAMLIGGMVCTIAFIGQPSRRREASEDGAAPEDHVAVLSE